MAIQPSHNKSKNFKGVGDLGSLQWSTIKKNASTRNILFEITIDQAWGLFELQHRKCSYTGQILTLIALPGWAGRKNVTGSLDRIDSSKGYTVENCTWVHKDINRLKWDLAEDQIINLCNMVTNYQKEKENAKQI
jgi:hypothetical protein